MIGWLSNQKRRAKRKAARDTILREELAAKARTFEPDVKHVLEDFTDLTINGMRQRVHVDRITIMAVTPITE
jgi:hypothetical protein